MDINRIINSLNKLIENKTITKGDLAKGIGVSRPTLDGYLSGNTQMKALQIQKAAETIGMTIEELENKPSNAKIFSFVNRKGGVGKTTICNLIAIANATLYNKKVLVIDTDTQQSTSQLAQEGTHDNIEVKFINFDSRTPIADLLTLLIKSEKLFDYIFVDVMGSFSQAEAINTILLKSDYIIIPIESTELSLGSTLQTLGSIPETVERRKGEGLQTTAIGIHNKVNKSSKEGKELKNINKLLSSALGGFKIMENYLTASVRYQRHMNFEELPFDMDKGDEFLKLVQELKSVVDNG